jgi:hypothetical protein
MNHPIRCSCGVLKGTVSKTDVVNRCVCYCTDCQAFAHFLKRNTEILDGLGELISFKLFLNTSASQRVLKIWLVCASLKMACCVGMPAAVTRL